jgi:hypothetical protein
VRKLIINGGRDNGRLNLDSALQPQHLELFLVHAVEMSRRTKHFEHEWRRLQQLFPYLKETWEKGQTLFQEALADVIDRPEEMEYLSIIDVVTVLPLPERHNFIPMTGCFKIGRSRGYMSAWQ